VVYATADEQGGRRDKARATAKLEAMKCIANEFYSKYPEQTWKNILSLGDMKYEHEAVQELAFSRRFMHRECLRTKAILLPRRATLSELTLRLQFSRLLLSAYVQHNGDLDLDLRRAKDPLRAIATALGMPQLGDVPFPRHAWGRTPVPEERVAEQALVDVAVTLRDSLEDRDSVALHSRHSWEEEEFDTSSAGEVTWNRLVRGTAEGMLATVLGLGLALVATEEDLMAAEALVDLCYSLYIFLIAAMVVATLQPQSLDQGSDAAEVDLNTEPLQIRKDCRVWVFAPWAEDLAATMYCRSLGYLWADLMYALLVLSLGYNTVWAGKLAHYILQSALSMLLLLPGPEVRARCCVLGMAYLADSALRLAQLLALQEAPWSPSIGGFSSPQMWALTFARVVNAIWLLYMVWLSCRGPIQCMLRALILCTIGAHMCNFAALYRRFT